MFSPFGNTYQTQNSAWRPEPTYRGTYGVLSSCLITLSLCIWSAVHLNIPEHKRVHIQVWRKLGWLTIGLLAPEMVAWTAFQQRSEARELYRELKGIFGENTPLTWSQRFLYGLRKYVGREKELSQDTEGVHFQENTGTPLRKYAWSMDHSHFALMGGFAFDTTDSKQDFLPGKRTRITVTASGVYYLARNAPSLLPDISREQIQDKSNANGLVKALVCLQALWFCIQCVSRLGCGLSISLLELNTLGHAICTLLIYALWWHKPLDVEEPVLIQGEHMHEFCAAMCMLSLDPVPTSSEEPWQRSIFWHDPFRDGQFVHCDGFRMVESGSVGLIEAVASGVSSKTYYDSFVNKYCTPTVYERFCVNEACNAETGLPTNENLPAVDPHPRDQRLRLYMGYSLCGFAFKRTECPVWFEDKGAILSSSFKSAFMMTKTSERRWHTYKTRGVLSFCRPFISLTAGDVYCWKMASQRIRKEEQGERVFYSSVADRIDDWPKLYGLPKGMEVVFWVSFSIAGLLYGGLHLLAWNAPFSSKAEAVMWRMSGAFLSSSGPLILLYHVVAEAPNWIKYNLQESNPVRIVHRWLSECDAGSHTIGFILGGGIIIIFVVVVLALALLYLVARAYLVVECFINISHLPDQVYEVPTWSQYFPHIA